MDRFYNCNVCALSKVLRGSGEFVISKKAIETYYNELKKCTKQIDKSSEREFQKEQIEMSSERKFTTMLDYILNHRVDFQDSIFGARTISAEKALIQMTQQNCDVRAIEKHFYQELLNKIERNAKKANETMKNARVIRVEKVKLKLRKELYKYQNGKRVYKRLKKDQSFYIGKTNGKNFDYLACTKWKCKKEFPLKRNGRILIARSSDESLEASHWRAHSASIMCQLFHRNRRFNSIEKRDLICLRFFFEKTDENGKIERSLMVKKDGCFTSVDLCLPNFGDEKDTANSQLKKIFKS